MTSCKRVCRALFPVVVLAVVAWGCGPGDAIDYRGSGILDSGGGMIEAGDVTIEARPHAVYEVARFEVEKTVLPEPLPEGLRLVGSPVDIDVDRDDQLDLPVKIAMRYDDTGIADETDLLVLHYDYERGWESVTMLAHDMEENVITFESRVFSPFVIAAIGIWPPDKFHVGFDVVDNSWNIDNFGDSFSPAGNCLGMSAYACWCFMECHDYLNDKYDWESAHLTAIRAHQAQSQYWALKQFDLEQMLGPSRTAKLLRAYLYYTKDAQIFLMFGNVGGHATVAYAYEPDKFIFYDVNTKDTEQQVAFTNGNFGNYSVFNQYGYVGFPSLGRTEDFGDLTAQAVGGFKQADHIEVTSPAQEEKIRGTSVSVQGSIDGLNKSSALLVYKEALTNAPSVAHNGNGAFTYNWTGLQMGKNRLILLDGTPIGSQSNWHRNGDTYILEVERVPEHETECDDGVDNDADGMTDCDDEEDCKDDPACATEAEVCDDEIDNDEDGLTDCEDEEDCKDDPACNAVECENTEDIHCGDTVTGTTSGASSIDIYPGCSDWDESGPEKIYILRDAPPGHVSAVVEEVDEEGDQDFDVFALENNCTGEACKESGNHEAWFGVDPGKIYYIVVDGYQGSEGEFRLTVTCE